MAIAQVDCIRCGKPGAANTLHECAPIFQLPLNSLVRCIHCNGVYEQGGIHRCQRGPADTFRIADTLTTNLPTPSVKERQDLFVKICLCLLEHYPGIQDTKRLCGDAKDIADEILRKAQERK